MYDNIGSKIKNLARIIFYVQSAIGLLLGFLITALFSFGSNDIKIILLGLLLGVIVAAVFAVISWVNTILIYGYGELIESTNDIKANTIALFKYIEKNKAVKSKSASQDYDLKFDTLKSVKSEESKSKYDTVINKFDDCTIENIVKTEINDVCDICSERFLRLNLCDVTRNDETTSVKICSACLQKIKNSKAVSNIMSQQYH